MRFIHLLISGMLAAIGAMVCELILSSLISILFSVNIESAFSSRITFFLFIAVLIEESFKFALLFKLLSSIRKKSSPLISGMIFGSGFAVIEIFSKSVAIPSADFFLFDFSGIFLIHIFTAGIIGCFVARSGLSAFPGIISTLSIPIILHLIYNLMIIYAVNASLVYAYLFSIMIAISILARYLQNKNKSTIINSR